jgi:hypothetical protein
MVVDGNHTILQPLLPSILLWGTYVFNHCRCHLYLISVILLGGIANKTPIDLSSGKGAL